jgi:hypothetical protein
MKKTKIILVILIIFITSFIVYNVLFKKRIVSTYRQLLTVPIFKVIDDFNSNIKSSKIKVYHTTVLHTIHIPNGFLI